MKKKRANKAVLIRISPKRAEQLKKLAIERDVSQGRVVEDALNHYVMRFAGDVLSDQHPLRGLESAMDQQALREHVR